jgi:hypothetical protein
LLEVGVIYMSDMNKMGISLAVQDFRRARRKAALQEVFARFTSKSADLLSYEEVRDSLRGRKSAKQELREIAEGKEECKAGIEGNTAGCNCGQCGALQGLHTQILASTR